MSALGLHDHPPSEAVELLRYDTDSSPELYIVLQQLTSQDVVTITDLEWNNMCFAEDASYMFESSEIVIRLADAHLSVYVIALSEAYRGESVVTRSAYDNFREAKRAYRSHCRKLDRIFDDL